MAQYKAFHPGDQVVGTAMAVMIHGMRMFPSLATPLLKRHKLESVIADSEHWYKQQSLLDALVDVSKQIGERTLIVIGRAGPEKALWPPGIDSLEAALQSVDIAYHMNHGDARGKPYLDLSTSPPKILPGIGNYKMVQTGQPRRLEMVCSDPYPCAFNQGFLEAIADKFGPLGSKVKVTHLSDVPCKAKGKESCTFRIEW